MDPHPEASAQSKASALKLKQLAEDEAADLGAPAPRRTRVVACGTCIDSFSLERSVLPYSLPCGHVHCGKCLREFVCEFGSGRDADKLLSDCTVCRDRRTFKAFKDIPCDLELAAECDGTRVSYSNEDVGQLMGRAWELPVKEKPENLQPLTDCVAHMLNRCTRKATCMYRHSSRIAGEWATFCVDWINGSMCFDRHCPLLHPPIGMLRRSDCNLSMGTSVCRGWTNPKHCPMKHVHNLQDGPPAVGPCEKWLKSFACMRKKCSKWHPPNISASDFAATRDHTGVLDFEVKHVAVFWDLNTCPIPAGVWAYSVATCVDRFLRVMGCLDDKPGYSLSMVAAIDRPTSATLQQELLGARAKLNVVGLEAGAVVDCLASNFTKSIMKYNPEHISAIVFLTGNPEFAQYIRQATNSRYHTILIVPTVTAAAEPGLTEPAAHVELWEDILAIAIPSPLMAMRQQLREQAERDLTSQPGTQSDLAATSTAAAAAGLTAAAARTKAIPAPKGKRPSPCPFFVPALQNGCNLGDACPYYHEKTACKSMMSSSGCCENGMRCGFRHVPLSGAGRREPYIAVAKTMERDAFGLLPPRVNSEHSAPFYKRGVRKVFTLAEVEVASRFPVDEFEPPQPGYWTCSACAYKYNAPPILCASTECVCDLCGKDFSEVGPPAQAVMKCQPGCWYCKACTFASNTLGMDIKCQICETMFLSDEDSRLKFWFCEVPECAYENREDNMFCDACGIRRS